MPQEFKPGCQRPAIKKQTKEIEGPAPESATVLKEAIGAIKTG